MRNLGGVACVRAGSAVDRAAQRRGSPQGPRPVPVVRVSRRLGLSPLPPPHGNQPDASGRTGRTPAGRTPDRPDTSRPDAGSRTTNPVTDTGQAGHRTAGQPGPGRRNRMGGHRMLDADRRPTPWLASWHCRARRRCLTAGCPLDRRRVGDQQTRTAQRQGLRGASRSQGRGLTTATTGSCLVTSRGVERRLGALLSSDDYGPSVKRAATLRPLWQWQCEWAEGAA